MPVTIEKLADQIGAELRGDGSKVVFDCAGLEEAGTDDVSFLANPRYSRFLATTKAAAVILSPDHAISGGELTLLIADDPYFSFRQAMVALHGFREHPPPGISAKASIDPAATIGAGCCILPNVFVAADARIGARCVLYPNCYIGPRTLIGDDCILYPNVTVYEACAIGNRVTLHAGCVIGQDGFGYATHNGVHHKIPHVGNVVIDDDVEMGANCSVDRATVGSTRIGAGSKLSDLVAIGHGTTVGRHNMLVAQVGIAGSAQTGDYVVMGGQVGVVGHIKVGSHNQFAGKTAIVRDISDGPGRFGGIPAVPLPIALRNAQYSARMPQFIANIRKMELRLAELERRLGGSQTCGRDPTIDDQASGPAGD